MKNRSIAVAALLMLGCCMSVYSQPFEPFGIDMGMPGVGDCFPDLYRADQYGSGLGYCPVMEAAARAGAQWVRLYVQWRFTEPQQGQFDWTQLDYMVNYARSKGMEVYFIPFYAPAWARGSSCVDCHPFEADPNRRLDAGRAVIDPDYTYSFFYNLASHFRDRVTYYGVWNEPDHLDMYNLMSENWNQHYLIEWLERYLFPAYNAVKAVDPNLKVVATDLMTTDEVSCGYPGYWVPNCRWKESWLQPLMQYYSGAFDVVSIHAYKANHTEVKNMMDSIRSLLGSKHIWITEGGFNSTGGQWDSTQSNEMHLTYVDLFNRQTWWDKWFYTFIHDGDNVPWCTGNGLLCHVAPSATTVTEKLSYRTYQDITP